MAVELATYYVSIIPSARGIEKNIAKELSPVSGIAAVEGAAAGKALGGGISAGVERGATSASGSGRRILTTFAQRTGGLFQSLDRQLGNFGGPFTGNLTTIGTSLRTVAAGEKNVALGASEMQRVGTAAYLGIGLAALGFGAVSIKSALGAEAAHAQLEQAIQHTKGAYDDYGHAIDQSVEKLAKFGFDQEEVNASLAKLTRASKDPAKALELVGTAADIARAKNLDLGSASQILVNIEAGRVRGLAQLGISTKDANGKTVTSEEAIRRITALYGGAAAANAKTYAGELQAVGAEAHNLEERIGGALLPVVADLGKDLLVGVDALKVINSATGGWLGTLAGAAFVAGGVLVAVNKISSGIEKLVGLFGIETAATETLTVAEAENATVAEADAVAQGELAASSGVAAASLEAEAASAGILSTSLSGIAAPLAALAIGFIAGKKGGDELNKMITGTTPKVDDLTAQLLQLEKGVPSAFDFKGIGGNLKDQIDKPDSLFGLPGAFGKSLLDSVTGGGAHKAKAEIGPLNDALKSILQTEGVDKATLAYGRLRQGLTEQGVSVRTLDSDFGPFQSSLDLARAKEVEVATSTDDLAGSFSDLAKGLENKSAQLGIADQLDSAKTAIDDLTQIRLDAAGQGDKSKQAAQSEAQAQQSLTDAYRSQGTAATSLADAKAKLAQFDSPTDQRIRVLEQQNIAGRVVTTPEEARQKEIDLLQFTENNANKRADLQAQVVTAENGVRSATEGVEKAQHAVSDASEARRKVQTDAAAAIAGAERKAQEAIIGAGKAINDANVAGQLGKGNRQLDIYVGLLDGLSKRLDPSSPLSKNLDAFLSKALKTAPFVLNGVDLSKLPASGSAKDPFAGGRGDRGNTTSLPTVTITNHNQFYGGGVPTTEELNTLNRKQAVRLSAAITGGRH